MNIALSASDFQWIVPEITITVAGLLALLVTAFVKGRGASRVAGMVTLAGAVVALVSTWMLWDVRTSVFNGLYTIDAFGTFLKLIFVSILFLVTIMSFRYTDREDIVEGEYYSLLSFAVLGMMVMVSSTSFVTIFIGLEVMSL